MLSESDLAEMVRDLNHAEKYAREHSASWMTHMCGISRRLMAELTRVKHDARDQLNGARLHQAAAEAELERVLQQIRGGR